jgi:hypothetical protein
MMAALKQNSGLKAARLTGMSRATKIEKIPVCGSQPRLIRGFLPPRLAIFLNLSIYELNDNNEPTTTQRIGSSSRCRQL